MSSLRALSHIGARPSGWHVEEEVDSDEVEVVYFEDLGMVEPEETLGETGVKPVVEEGHLGESIILKNPRLKVTNEELSKLRYPSKYLKMWGSKPYKLMNELIRSYPAG